MRCTRSDPGEADHVRAAPMSGVGGASRRARIGERSSMLAAALRCRAARACPTLKVGVAAWPVHGAGLDATRARVEHRNRSGFQRRVCALRWRNRKSFLPEASACFNHLGCRPRPDQVSPVAASRYLAATLAPAALRSLRLGRQIGQRQTMLGHQRTHPGHGGLRVRRACASAICCSMAAFWASSSLTDAISDISRWSIEGGNILTAARDIRPTADIRSIPPVPLSAGAGVTNARIRPTGGT